MTKKKTLASFLSISFAFSIAVSCGSNNNSSQSQKATTDNSQTVASTTDNYQTSSEETYSVQLIIESEDNIYFGTYPVDIIIDNGAPLVTINDGNTEILNLTLSKGSHIIRFQRNGEEDFYTEVTADIENDCTLKYYMDCHSKVGGGIKVKLNSSEDGIAPSETTQIEASEASTDIVPEKETTETEIQTEVTTETQNTSVYDAAYKLKGKGYNPYDCYYLFDFDNHIAYSFTSNDNGIMMGKYTGDFEEMIDLYYSGEGLNFHDYIREKKKGDDSTILVTVGDDPMDMYAEYKKSDVEEAEAIMNQDGYRIINPQ